MMSLDLCAGFFTQMSDAWGYVRPLSPWSVKTSSCRSCTWLLQHGSLRVAGHLTCVLGPQSKCKSCVAFYHLALESHTCHFCSTKMIEVVRI